MREARVAVADGCFLEFKEEFLAQYPTVPHEIRTAHREKRRSRNVASRPGRGTQREAQNT